MFAGGNDEQNVDVQDASPDSWMMERLVIWHDVTDRSLQINIGLHPQPPRSTVYIGYIELQQVCLVKSIAEHVGRKLSAPRSSATSEIVRVGGHYSA